MVSINRTDTFIISVVDTNLHMFSIINGDGALIRDRINSSLYTFTWTPTEFIDTTTLFIATDELGASTQYEPKIEFCNCINEGICTLNGTLNQMANPIDLNCICNNSGKMIRELNFLVLITFCKSSL